MATCSLRNLAFVASVIVCAILHFVASVIMCDRFSIHGIDVRLTYIKEATKQYIKILFMLDHGCIHALNTIDNQIDGLLYILSV